MAKKGWPTVSKGIFYPGFNSGKSESKSAGERPNKSTMKQNKAVSPMTELGRILYPAKSVNTEMGMRKPSARHPKPRD